MRLVRSEGTSRVLAGSAHGLTAGGRMRSESARRRVMRLLWTAVSTLAIVLVPVQSANAHSQFKNGGTGDMQQACSPCYVWTPNYAHHYYIANWIKTVHPAWRQYINASVSKWNAAPVGDPIWLEESVPEAYEMIFDHGDLSLAFCGYSYVEDVAGVNSVGWRYLTHTRIKYNDNYSYYRSGQSTGQCEFDWTTMHEVGHAGLALGHTNTSSAVMWHNDNRQTVIQSDDIASLNYLY